MDPSTQKFKNPLVWIDLEMTGLDWAKEQIIEIAVIVTEADDLTSRLEGPDIIIHADKTLLDSMDDWCTKTHGHSGLTE